MTTRNTTNRVNQRNNELYAAVIAGDLAARDAMIVNNLGLVVAVVNGFIGKVPGAAYLRDDLVSAGHIGLVKAVTKLAQVGRKVPFQSVAPWLGRFILREVRTVLPQERTIHVPSATRKLYAQNKRPLETPAVFNALPETLETCSEIKAVDLRDVINACCDSEVTRECLRLHEEGYTLVEIGQRVGLTKSTVQRRLQALKQRVFHCWFDGSTRTSKTP
jgi:RNA polymerase sigma factor (sigma-70 family)